MKGYKRPLVFAFLKQLTENRLKTSVPTWSPYTCMQPQVRPTGLTKLLNISEPLELRCVHDLDT